jgi:hypothetical protein
MGVCSTIIVAFTFCWWLLGYWKACLFSMHLLSSGVLAVIASSATWVPLSSELYSSIGWIEYFNDLL